jgi:hypothetical protein
MGVASLGHGKLCGRSPNWAAHPAAAPIMPALIPPAVTPPPLAASAEAAGERRHLTVMFSDLTWPRSSGASEIVP